LGKAVPKGIKSKALLLLKEFPERFNVDFEHNKAGIADLSIPFSKTNRNLVVGYVTRKVKQREAREKAKAAAAKRSEERKAAAKPTEKAPAQ